MDPTGSKRIKMSGEKVRKTIFNPCATTFEEIVKMEGFVDHTNVIKNIVNENKSAKFVVAPSRFGKSANMNAAHSFLEIEVDNTGNSIRDVGSKAAKVDELKKPGLKNYELFCFPKPRCQILEDEDFVLEHFGRYPVVILDFAVEEVTSYDSAVLHCLAVINRAYKMHKYLLKSTILGDDELKFCQMYCSWLDLSQGDVFQMEKKIKTALEHLVMFLHSHFKRKVVLLIDEFDAVVSKAKFVVKNEELLKISGLIIDMLGQGLKGNIFGLHVAHVFLTGIETVNGLGNSPRMAGVEKYGFLDDEHFVGFYGAVEGEIIHLVTKLKNKDLLHENLKGKSVEDIMKVIYENYNGYYSQGPECKSIFCLWSVLHFLQKGIVESHWAKPSPMVHIKGCINSPIIAARLLQLTGKKAGEEIVQIRKLKSIDILKLRGQIGLERTSGGPDVDLVFSYLKELGYLSHVKGSTATTATSEINSYTLKIANEEVRKELLNSLTECDKIAGFDFIVMQQVADMFEEMLSSQSDTEFHKCLNDFYMILKKLFKGFEKFSTHDKNESVLLSVLCIALSKVTNWTRFSSDIRIKDDDGSNLTLGRTDIWMKYVDPMTGKIYLIIFEDKVLNAVIYKSRKQQIERTSLYGLREILGLETKAPYIEAVKDIKPDDFLCIGLSMDHETNKPSISAIRNSYDIKEAVCLSETEFKKFSEYYEGYKNFLILEKDKKLTL